MTNYCKLRDIAFEENNVLLLEEEEYKEKVLKEGKEIYQLQKNNDNTMILRMIGMATESKPIMIKHSKLDEFEMKILSNIFTLDDIKCFQRNNNPRFTIIKIIIQYLHNKKLLDILEIRTNFISSSLCKKTNLNKANCTEDEYKGFLEIEIVQDTFHESLSYFPCIYGKKTLIPKILNEVNKKGIRELIKTIKNKIIT